MRHPGKFTLAALALTALSACGNGNTDEQGGGVFGAPGPRRKRWR